MDRAGLVGADGPTHCGAFDVTYMACLPNMVVMAPSDEAELFHMVATAAAIDDRPSCFRYPRGNGVGVQLPPENKGIPLEVGVADNLFASVPMEENFRWIDILFWIYLLTYLAGWKRQDIDWRGEGGTLRLWYCSPELFSCCLFSGTPRYSSDSCRCQVLQAIGQCPYS